MKSCFNATIHWNHNHATISIHVVKQMWSHVVFYCLEKKTFLYNNRSTLTHVSIHLFKLLMLDNIFFVLIKNGIVAQIIRLFCVNPQHTSGWRSLTL